MNEALRQYKTLFILIFAGILTSIIIGIIIFYNSQPSPITTPPPQVTITPQPTQTSQTDLISPLQKTYPGVTSARSIEQLSNRKSKIEREDGGTEYHFSSITKMRDNTIVTSDDMVVFERIIPSDNGQLPIFSELKKTHGMAEEIKKGAVSYGKFIETHIYASQGFAFMVNPLTDRVYEIHVFVPTSVSGYLSRWGADITGYKEPEGHL